MRLNYNGVRAVLSSTLDNDAGDTGIDFAAALKHSNGVNVPTIGAGNYIPLCLLDANNGELREIVHLTDYTAGQLDGTVIRAREGTAAVAHPIGRVVACAPTVQDWEQDRDTGWRNIESLCTPPGSAVLNWARIRRIGSRVSFALNWADNQSNPFRVGLFAPPAGFRAEYGGYFYVPYDAANDTRNRCIYWPAGAGTIQYGGPSHASSYSCVISVLTADAWPAALPGTAA